MTEGKMGDSRKYPYLYYGWFFGILLARGVLWTQNPKAWGDTHNENSQGMGGRVSRGDRQVCECTNKLTTTEGKIQDKHQHACVHVHLQKASVKIWLVHWAVRKSFATNADPPCLFTMYKRYMFIKKLLKWHLKKWILFVISNVN